MAGPDPGSDARPGFALQPKIAAPSMSGSSIVVAINARLFKRARVT
jgi:cation transport ATPase